MIEYPRLSLEERIKGGYKYSYHYNLVVPYTNIETFKASLPLVRGRIEKRFPLLSLLQLFYVYVNTKIPDKVDFVFIFSQEPELTHNQFSGEIRSIAKETYWSLSLQEVVLLSKPFPWTWVGIGLTFLALKEG